MLLVLLHYQGMDLAIWAGIGLCLLNSAMFSGLTLALFSLSRLRLEVEVESGNKAALRILKLRKNSNLLLATLLWGNVSVNCLLTLLSDSVMVGFYAFIFSTVGITFFGEIIPQAYFSRNAMRVGAFLSPIVILYQIILYPVTKPTAWVLDVWLGHESITYFQEQDFRHVLRKHIQSEDSDIDRLEGIGALNFLSLDDLKVIEEGEIIDPDSIIELPMKGHLPDFPEIERVASDPFLQQVQRSDKKWVILIDSEGEPQLVVNADALLRSALYQEGEFRPLMYCHRPIIIRDPATTLDKVILKFKVFPKHREDDVIDNDIVLYWNTEKRIITGADLLGRLLRGIVSQQVNPDFLNNLQRRSP